MKRLSTIMMCLLAMMAASASLKAQQVTIPLMPGWTWISYPSTDTVDFATAFGSFTPAEGDIIESQFDYSEYIEGCWLGGTQQFYPGYGYLYYSSRNMPVFLTFNAQPAPQLTVTTAEPTEITANSAVSGGSIISNDGNYIYVFMKGICWATHPNPMVMNDSYTENGSGAESFTAEMTGLYSGMVYYVRAFAVTSTGTIYGNELSFCTDHEYVDLGLPSGTLWATCNVGAATPEDYGYYFAWGETQPKSIYDLSTYQYSTGNSFMLIKYCYNSIYGSFGFNGFTDSLTVLLPEDDAATANWGENWRMPTDAEWEELYSNTTHIWSTQNGVNGRLFTSNNGNSLFLPAAGYRIGNSLDYDGSYGGYWSSSLYMGGYPYCAWSFFFNTGNCGMRNHDRYAGRSIRPVCSSGHK